MSQIDKTLEIPASRTTRYLQKYYQVIGPGIMFASCAIGVSHLVQSTRAGAEYGFSLLLFVVAANVLKFPFFEYGSRYASATGQSILEGYRQRGRWILVLYLLLTLSSMFSVAAAVTFVCAGLFGNLLGLEGSATLLSGVLLLACGLLLSKGKFRLLDNGLKILAVVLFLTTFTAFITVLWKWQQGSLSSAGSSLPGAAVLNSQNLPFIIALMGWMPTAVDLSAWNSLWTLEKIKQTGYRPTLNETLFDFNLGYWLSAILAVCFLTLGALLFYGSGTVLSDSSVAFAGQVISLYTAAIGSWCYPIIAIAAATVMFSTVITVLDGYSRALNDSIQLLQAKDKKPDNRFYLFIIWVLAILSFIIISLLPASLSLLVDFATTLSFVIAPVIAALNFLIIKGKEVPKEKQPGLIIEGLSWLGLLFLTGFTLLFFWTIA